MDKEVLRDIWQGQLPLCFKLHQDDISGMHNPEPYYMMVPRITYFPLVLDRVIKYFIRFTDQNKQDLLNELWLDYDGQPIKWHHPIGLSWDLLGSSYNLPWTLILHFSDFPANQLVRCNSKLSIRPIFMSSLKEADALKHKSVVIMNIVEKDLNQLWSSLQNDKFEQFWKINSRLMEKTDNKLFKNIPFRIYFPDYTYVQRSIQPIQDDKETTMLDLILVSFLDRMDDLLIEETKSVNNNKNNNTNTSMESPKSSKEDEKATTTKSDDKDGSGINVEKRNLDQGHHHEGAADEVESATAGGGSGNDDSNNDNNNDFKKQAQGSCGQTKETTKTMIDVRLFKYRFVTHGIEVPLYTPLQWLSENLSHPDNFLHIAAVSKATEHYT